MDEHTYSNWVKVKETFEKSGNTDNMFYKRAVEIVKTRREKKIIRVGITEEKGYPSRIVEDVKNPDISDKANKVEERKRTTAISSITDWFI